MTRANRRRQEADSPSLVALDPEEAAAYLFERIESGRGLSGLRRADATGPSGEAMVLLSSARPEWYLAERLPGRAFRRAPRKERTWLEWPACGPADATGLEDPRAGEIILASRGGAFRILRLSGQFRDVSIAADHDVEGDPGEGIPAGAWQPLSVACPMSMAPARRPKMRQIPEVWLLPASETWRIERILAATAEDDHDFLLVAPLEGPDGPLVAVREVARGRRAPRMIPEGGRTFCPLPGTSNAFIRSGLELLPRLPGRLALARAQAEPGTVVLVDAGPGGQAEALILPESAFSAASMLRTVQAPPARTGASRTPAPTWPTSAPFADDLSAPKSPDSRRSAAPSRWDQRLESAPSAPKPSAERKQPTKPRPSLPHAPPQQPPQAAAAAAPKPEPRDQALVMLERSLVEDPEDHEAWRSYSRALAIAGEAEGATAAMEECLWHSPPAERESAWRGLLEAIRSDGQPTRDFYSAVAELERPGRDHLAWAAAAVEAWRRVDSPRWPARKKRRWIAWARIGAITGDVIELERRRETLLAELASGVREYEAPRFLRPRLMEKYSASEAASGNDPAAAAAFLEAAAAFARKTFGHPGTHPAGEATPEALMSAAALQASFHSSLALRWLHAGMRQEAERALEAAATAAARLVPSKSVQVVPAMAKFAAASDAIRGAGMGIATLRSALDAASKAQPDGSAKQALVSWLRAAATMPPQNALPDMAREAFEALWRLPPVQCASALRECAKDICALGLRDRGVEAARSIIAMGRGKDHPRRFLAVCEYATSALQAFCDGRLSNEDAESVIAVAARMHEEIDEFAPAMLAPAFGASGDPWGKALEFVRAMRDVKDEHAALIGALSGLRCLAESGARDVGLPALEEAVARTAAWDVRPGAGALKRMRILIRLARLAPSFGARERGMGIVRILRRAADASHDRVIKTELMCEAIKCASSLGVPDEASRLLDETLTAITSRSEGSDLETLNEIVEATAKLGDVGRGMALLTKVADEAARKVADHAAATDAPRSDTKAQERVLPRLALFKYHKALAGCAASALLLGDEAASARFMESALGGIDRLDGADRLDIAQAASKGIAELPPERRRFLGLKALDAFAKAAAPGTSQHSRKLACEGAERLVADVSSGETAFAAAMTRWLGDEERRIRVRVVAEQCGGPA